jgi:hypothetical protein
MSWDIKTRVRFIETRWPYFFGFGLTLSLITSFAGSYIYSATLFASIFPLFILSAIEANCENLEAIKYQKFDSSTGTMRTLPLNLSLFQLALKITDYFFKIFTSRKQNQLSTMDNNSQQKQQQQQQNISKIQQQPILNIRKTN